MTKPKNDRPTMLSAVALLASLPKHGLARGQVGTVVEELDADTVLVEFSDDQGAAYAIIACPLTNLITLHYVPQAA